MWSYDGTTLQNLSSLRSEIGPIPRIGRTEKWGCGNNSSRETDTCNPGENLFGHPRFDPNSRFFRRTDLRISLSRAKFDEEADFEVRLAVAPQKPCQISKKWKFWSNFFGDFFFRRWKTKCRESSETCFPKVWGRTESCLRVKWPFKVSNKFFDSWNRSLMVVTGS